jgi:hypothetical protein
MATTALIAKVHTDEKDGLMFYRDRRPTRPTEYVPDPGAITRYYRFVYPNLPFEQRTHGDWLEALVKRNSWLR